MFSIIMPYYKNSAIVKRSIDSVINQGFSDFELIIVDDGSEDTISQIVEEYNDGRIRLIKQSNTGVAGARNKGIKNAINEYICFLDSDDQWLPNHLEVLDRNISEFQEEVFFVTGHKRLGGETFLSTNRLGMGADESLLVEDYFKFAIDKFEIIHTNSVCINKSVFNKVNMFEEGVNRGEDVDLWFRLAFYFNVIFINEITTLYHRDFSYLTSELSCENDGIFIDRRSELLKDIDVLKEKKESLEVFLDRIIISKTRRYIAMNDKRQALNEFKKVQYHTDIKKAYIITRAILILPIFISKPIINKIYANKFKSY